MPRSKTPNRVWTRQFRDVSLRIDAGALWIDGQWKDQPLPYGPKPRLLLAHICTEALRHGPVVELDRSTRALLRRLHLGQDGREMARLSQQSRALAASIFSLGWQRTTDSVKPIKSWIDDGKLGQTLVLSDDFFKILSDRAVPLDVEAMARLRHSAFALDVYVWLASRLYKVKKPQFLSWSVLQEQFADRYGGYEFRRDFVNALSAAMAVYHPRPKIDGDTSGPGLTFSSAPPQVRGIKYRR